MLGVCIAGWVIAFIEMIVLFIIAFMLGGKDKE